MKHFSMIIVESHVHIQFWKFQYSPIITYSLPLSLTHWKIARNKIEILLALLPKRKKGKKRFEKENDKNLATFFLLSQLAAALSTEFTPIKFFLRDFHFNTFWWWLLFLLRRRHRITRVNTRGFVHLQHSLTHSRLPSDLPSHLQCSTSFNVPFNLSLCFFRLSTPR